MVESNYIASVCEAAKDLLQKESDYRTFSLLESKLSELNQDSIEKNLEIRSNNILTGLEQIGEDNAMGRSKTCWSVTNPTDLGTYVRGQLEIKEPIKEEILKKHGVEYSKGKSDIIKYLVDDIKGYNRECNKKTDREKTLKDIEKIQTKDLKDYKPIFGGKSDSQIKEMIELFERTIGSINDRTNYSNLNTEDKEKIQGILYLLRKELPEELAEAKPEEFKKLLGIEGNFDIFH